MKHRITAIVIVGVMFFIFGLVSWVNAILIPYFKIACELTHFEAYFVTFAFYIAYLLLSVPSAGILKGVGYKRGIMYGFLCMSLGAALFIPAALFVGWDRLPRLVRHSSSWVCAETLLSPCCMAT